MTFSETPSHSIRVLLYQLNRSFKITDASNGGLLTFEAMFQYSFYREYLAAQPRSGLNLVCLGCIMQSRSAIRLFSRKEMKNFPEMSSRLIP